MKKILLALAIAVAGTAPALAAVGVSVNIGQPGFYGQIDIGDYGRPELVRSRPVIIERGRVVGEPVYLRVPYSHRQNWRRYCGRYQACGRQVYFVQDNWYNNVYAPRYRERHGDNHPGNGRNDVSRREYNNHHDGDKHGHGKRGHDNNGHDRN